MDIYLGQKEFGFYSKDKYTLRGIYKSTLKKLQEKDLALILLFCLIYSTQTMINVYLYPSHFVVLYNINNNNRIKV